MRGRHWPYVDHDTLRCADRRAAAGGSAAADGLRGSDQNAIEGERPYNGSYPLVEVYRLPSQPDKAEPVVFLSHLPPGSQQGPQADSDLLRHLAAASARQHRMMLSGCCLFDRYGTVNGRLIAPTLPVVQRNAAGYVLDARDKVIAERGAPTRRATHRRAVQTGARETNPEADRYPWLADRDLILLGYPFVAATPSARRNQRRRVHEAVVALRDRSALDFKAEYRTPKHGGKPELVALRLLPSASDRLHTTGERRRGAVVAVHHP